MAQDSIPKIDLAEIQLPYPHREMHEAGDLTVYVNFDHKVFIEDKQIIFWDNLISEIINRNNDFDTKAIYLSKVFFKIDKGAKYSFVDKIKEEISRVKTGLYCYLVNDGGSSKILLDRSLGTVKEKWRGFIPSRKKASIRYEITAKMLPETNSSPNFIYEFKAPTYLYEKNVEKIKETLPEGMVVGITLLPNKKIRYLNQTLDLDEIDNFRNMLRKGYVILYTFDDELSYEDYIFFLAKKHQLLKEKHEYYETFGALLEISISLSKELKELGFDFFDD